MLPALRRNAQTCRRLQASHIRISLLQRRSLSSSNEPSVDDSRSESDESDRSGTSSSSSTHPISPTSSNDPVHDWALKLASKHVNQLSRDQIEDEASKHSDATSSPDESLPTIIANSTFTGASPPLTRRFTKPTVKSGTFGERVSPIALSQLVHKEIPILQHLATRIQHFSNGTSTAPIRTGLVSNHNVHNVKMVPPLKEFPYPLHPATVNELRSMVKVLVEPPREKIPSQSSGMLLLSCPFRGSEKYLRMLVESLAAELNTSYLSLSTRDLFPRVSPFEVLSSPPIRGQSNSSDMNPWRGMMDGSSRRSRGSNLPMGNIGVINVGLNGHGISVNNVQNEENGDIKETDNPFLPYPWYKSYITNKGKPMSLISSRTQPSNADKPESATLIANTFETFFNNLIDKMTPTTTPFIIYYEDLMQLLTSPALNLQDTLQAIQQGIIRARASRLPLVLIAPSTPTFMRRRSSNDQVEGLQGALLATLSGRGDEDTAVDPTDDEPAPPHPENTGPLASLMGGNKKQVRAVRYDTPLDEWIGIPSVNVYPPADQSTMKSFLDQMKKDAREIIRSANAKEIDFIARSAELDFGEGSNAEKLLASQPKISGLLEERVLTQPEIERIVFMAASYQDTPSINSFKTAIHNFNHSQSALATLQGGIEYSGLFANPRDRLRLNQHEEKILSTCYIAPNNTGTTFGSIGGLAKTKQIIDDLIRLPLRRPELFNIGVLKSSTSGILLFGPPGTGKTMLARAVAHESGANFLSISMSAISSMWVGESEKNVKALFSISRKMKPCVIFVDEIDALLRARSRFTSAQYMTSTINEFMSEWDGLNSENNGVIVVGATNRPFDLDEAVLRRLPRRILVNLPDLTERIEILNILLKDEVVKDGHKSREDVIKAVAERTRDFSGSDLKNLCIAAALNALREQILPNDSDPSDSTSRTLHLKCFITPLESGEVVPSLSDRAELSKQLEEWNRMYGTGAFGYQSVGWGFSTVTP